VSVADARSALASSSELIAWPRHGYGAAAARHVRGSLDAHRDSDGHATTAATRRAGAAYP